MKRIGWKVLTGATSTYINGISVNPSDAIDIRVQKYLKEGWVLKGEMRRAHPSSTVWTQIIEKYSE
jgi:hypothetical protein